MTFKIIDDTELEDYNRAIEKTGYTPGDFEISEEVDPLTAGLISDVIGTATVTYKTSGAKRTYPVGHGTTWPVDFEIELRAGAFK